MTQPEDPAGVAVRVARAFERAAVEYAVGGSIAASAYGEPRATRDLDFAVRLSASQATTLVQELGSEFEVDTGALNDAIRSGRPVNIFYLPVFTKIDLFIRGYEPYDEAEFARRRAIEPVSGEQIQASSPEDNLLWKLRWFRKGGEVSDQQWRDVLGLMRVSGDTLDFDYLRTWARAHAVEDLLERALSQRPM